MSKIGDLKINMNTRKLSKVLSLVSKHTQAMANDLKEMDDKGCPECGSFEFRVEQDTSIGDRSPKLVKCMECGHEYVREYEMVELLSRK